MTSILNLKPEAANMVNNQRLAETDFTITNDLLKGVAVAQDAKAMRLNRR